MVSMCILLVRRRNCRGDHICCSYGDDKTLILMDYEIVNDQNKGF